MSFHVLIADDDPGVLSGLALTCRAAGYRTSEAASGPQALSAIRSERPDIVLVDIHMPCGNGLELLPQILDLERAPAVVVMSGLADVPTAVESMRQGASDFLEKPVRREVLAGVLGRIAKLRALERERDSLRTEVARLRSGPIIGRSAVIRRLLEQVGRVAATPRTTVLIQGESGVGKELVARAVHEHSSRAAKPFVALNCAALSEPLLEAELFGYEPGAFTGGSPKGREGLIAAAEGGSLFLDEIGELAPVLQAKLLRVLQERVYRRVGGRCDEAMDVRIIASTNRDLARMVERGEFREDLFYRLNVMSLTVPALREHPEDIAPLAAHFLSNFAAEFKKDLRRFAPGSIQRLERHRWPGNVRELHNTVERAALLCNADEILPEHLGLLQGAPVDGAPDALPLEERSLRAVEKTLIRRVLAETAGNRSRAAQVLGINRTTLYNKIKSYGI